MNQVLANFQNVTKWYKGHVIGLNQVSVSLHSGVTGLLGPNGAGKSTFLKLVMGQIYPNLGSVTVLGANPFRSPKLFHRLGYCPEQDSFYYWMTGYDFLKTMGKLFGLTGQQLKERIKFALTQVNLENVAPKKIKTYSKGMRQRLKFAQALLNDPELLVLDEPLNGADPITRTHLITLIHELGKQKAILVSSHVLHEVEKMTSNVLLLYRGRILAEGNIKQLRDLIYKHPHTVKFKTPDARKLAKLFLDVSGVVSLEFPPNTQTELLVRTNNPKLFYKTIPKLLQESNLPIHDLYTTDDNLEAVFEYLVNTH